MRRASHSISRRTTFLESPARGGSTTATSGLPASARSGRISVRASPTRKRAFSIPLSLAFSSANSLYGTHNSTPTAIQRLNVTTGARTAQATTSPLLSIRDITGINSSPQPSLPDCYAVGGDNSKIYKLDPVTGVTYILTSTAPFSLNAIARDPVNNILYWLRGEVYDPRNFMNPQVSLKK